ncbi:UDP-N-acetylglucosamine pyrophosphorylase [Cordyceps militaris]|uniref:UDP-N-acetylglucosamine pyrophosphorylase n=1 Tax=Cordyceps militaris TaxID=73501 RepID=A0A2H4S8A0_CORMI|nr:UDP-N-acetylglucosamine pyrophosphorylase [Cordyceps militaris]
MTIVGLVVLSEEKYWLEQQKNGAARIIRAREGKKKLPWDLRPEKKKETTSFVYFWLRLLLWSHDVSLPYILNLTSFILSSSVSLCNPCLRANPAPETALCRHRLSATPVFVASCLATLVATGTLQH